MGKIASSDEIIEFLIALAKGGVPLSCIGAGSYFVWAGVTFTKAAVTTVALGMAAPVIMVVGGLAMIGAGIWLAYVKETK